MSVCVSVCACVRVYVYVSVCGRVYVCMSACIHASIHVCMYVCMYVCLYVCVCVSMHVRMNACMHHQNFQDAPHGSAIFVKIKTLRTGAQCCSKFSGCSARERDFNRNFEDAPLESAIVLKNFKTLRTGSAILIIRERSGADQFGIELV